MRTSDVRQAGQTEHKEAESAAHRRPCTPPAAWPSWLASGPTTTWSWCCGCGQTDGESERERDRWRESGDLAGGEEVGGSVSEER